MLPQAFSASQAAPPAAGLGCTRSWEGTQPGQLTLTDQRDIPHHTTSCSAIKTGGRRRKGRMFGVMAFPYQVIVMCDKALLSWRWLNIFLLMGSSVSILCFAVLVRTDFALPAKLLLSQPSIFLTFTLLILSLIPPRWGAEIEPQVSSMTSSCIRAALDWIWGKMSLLKEWSGIGPGSPGQWWSPHPWRSSKHV